MAKLFRDESAAFNEAMRIRAYQQTYQGDEQLASRVVSNQRSWPQLSPGANLAVSQGGHDPDSSVAKEAARLSQKRKAKKSGNWLGNIVRAGTGAVGDVLEMGVGGVADLARGGIRGVTTVAGAPIEEATGVLRSVAGSIGGAPGGAVAGAGGGAALGATLGSIIPGAGTAAGAIVGGAIGGIGGLLAGEHIEGEGGFRFQSTLSQAVSQLDEEGGAQLGSGFLPGGRALEVATRERQRTATVAGRALTPGRLIAAGVTEPGHTPYNVLSGLIDFGTAMKLDPAALGLAKLGKINAARKTILHENARQFLDTEAGALLKGAFKDERSPYAILSMSKNQIPVDVAVRLADETDINNIDKILHTELGTSIRTKFQPTVSRRLGKKRLSLDMPHENLDWDNPLEFVQRVDALQALYKVPKGTRLANNDGIMRALSGPRGGRFDPVRQLSSTMADALTAQGLDATAAKKATRLVAESVDGARRYTNAEIGTNTRVPGVVINDQGVPIPAPSLISEMLDAPLHLPSRQELRNVRQAIGFMKPIFDTPYLGAAVHGSDILLTALMNKVWKPGVLARVALPLRVGGEEQIRMSTAGYDSVFAHPLSYIMRLTGRRGATGLTGENLADAVEAQRALTQRNAVEGFLDAPQGSMINTKHRDVFRPGSDDFIRGWRDHELGHLRADPVAQHLAKHGNQATKDWLWSKAGRKFLNEFRLNRPNDPTFMSTQLDVSAYVDDVVGKRISDFTQGDQRLLDYVIKGRKTGTAEKAAQQEITSVLDELVDAGRHPDGAVADIAIHVGEGAGQVYNTVVGTAFSWLMEKPTNFFNRSRVFTQAYWNRSEEIVTSMTPKAQATLLKNARAAKLPKAQIQRIEDGIARHSGELGIDQADFLAKGHGLTEVRSLLYDLSKRGMDADAVRLIMPFAEPWKEMMMTWSRLLVQKPQFGRRFQQVVEGARGFGAFVIDEQTGEEMFVYPGSEFISKVVTGVPVPFKGRVAGLNLFAQNPLIPGFGPLVQIPASVFIDNKPEFDWVQDAINPFGRSEEGVLEQFITPAAWMKKLRTATSGSESDRLFANTVMDMSRYLVSTGEYNTNSEEEQERLTQAATSAAKKLYFLRAGASLTAPSAPSPEFKSALKDTSGKVITQFKLMEEYHKLQEEDYDTAVEKFLDTYGEGALLYMQPKSKGGGPPVEEAQEWIRENPELSSRFPETYHFFGPRSGEFSMTAYERQLASGERESISPQEATKLANHRVAMLRWRQAKDKVGARPNDSQREWLNGIKDQLLDLYPGFEPEPRDPFRVKRMMRQLQDGLKDEKLASTEVGGALRVYFLARDKAVQAAKDAGLADHTRSKRIPHVREWLRGIGASIVERVPDFAAVYDQVLDREMVEDKADIGGSELPSG